MAITLRSCRPTVYPSNRHNSPKVKNFVDHVQAKMTPLPWETGPRVARRLIACEVTRSAGLRVSSAHGYGMNEHVVNIRASTAAMT